MSKHKISANNQFNQGTSSVRTYLIACIVATTTMPAFAQLSEAEGVGNWVLGIFSPALLLALLTILLIGCGIAVFFGRLSGGLFVKILIGSVLVFGARTIAPKIVALF